MRQVIFFAAVSALLMPATVQVATAQSEVPNAPANSENQPKTPADIAFEPIGRDVSNLRQSLANKGGIAPEDHAIIRATRDRVAAFGREFPADLRGPATELMLSKWLKDDDLVSSLYAKILNLDPTNDTVRFSWARLLTMENRFEEALDVLKNHKPDPAKDPAAAMILATCHFAQHRFQEALDALAGFPDPTTSPNFQGASSADQLRRSVKDAMEAWPGEQIIRQREESAGDLPQVLLVTSRGKITLELFEDQAPNTVANFIKLIDQGFYNTSKFHRQEPNFMAQGGDPFSKPGAVGTPGQGDPGYNIPDETERLDHRNHFTGSLAMAKTPAPNSGGCQFYITAVPTPHLNGKHTVFGRVIDGLDVAQSLKRDDVIELMTVIRRRPHEYNPQTLPLASASAPPAVPVTPPIDPTTQPPVAPPTDPKPPVTDPAVPPADPIPSPPPGN